jgi:UDP-N-acetylmuramate--alanine ligase
MQLGYRKQKLVFHIIGIGGIGMSAIAEVLHNFGYNVQGSDISENNNTARLSRIGVHIYHSHHESNVDNVDYVVVSTAIQPNNIEYIAAQNAMIPIIHRSEMMAEIMRMKKCVSISGSHGKTSTTAMVANLFEIAGMCPTVINGGIILGKNTNAYVGTGEYMIVEADESDATFIKIPSTIAVITNIDHEHLDFYGSFEKLCDAFKTYIQNLPFYGFAMCCIDNEAVKILASDTTNKRIITYGITSENANVFGYNICSTINGSYFDVKIRMPKDHKVITIERLFISIPGKHNVQNCLSVIGICIELGFGIDALTLALATFSGVKRRFNVVDICNKVSIIDDYAHHPAEIVAVLATARDVINISSKIIVVLQPHRYSRLSSLLDEMVNSLRDADIICVTEVYSAGEKCSDKVDHMTLLEKLSSSYSDKRIFFVKDVHDVSCIVIEYCDPGDVVLFMGAGDITHWSYALPDVLRGAA